MGELGWERLGGRVERGELIGGLRTSHTPAAGSNHHHAKCIKGAWQAYVVPRHKMDRKLGRDFYIKLTFCNKIKRIRVITQTWRIHTAISMYELSRNLSERK